MRIYFYLIISIFLYYGCAGESDGNKSNKPPIAEEIAQKLASQYGYDNWHRVKSLQFAFNVKKDSFEMKRLYQWVPSKQRVTYMDAQDTVTFLHPNSDTSFTEYDKKFINDKYWLIAPFQLIWDKRLTYKLDTAQAPITEKPMPKLTVQYPSTGGYTPGDAYDFYFNDSLFIQEWSYRKAGQTTPNLSTTWEDNEQHAGIHFCTYHKNKSGTFELFFTDLQIQE